MLIIVSAIAGIYLEICKRMTQKAKNRLIIVACAIGSLLTLLEIAWAVVNIVLINMGKETFLY